MLTYVCVVLIDFQAHRDAFIQNIMVSVDICNLTVGVGFKVFNFFPP